VTDIADGSDKTIVKQHTYPESVSVGDRQSLNEQEFVVGSIDRHLASKGM
jgi:hypothetical protein